MERFEELEVWQRAHKLTLDVYRLTGRNGAQYDFVPHGGLHRVA